MNWFVPYFLRVLLLFLQLRLVNDVLIAQADISKVVLVIQLLEEFLDLSVSHVVVEYATEFCIHDKNDTSFEDIVMAKMLVNHGSICSFYLVTLLRSSSIVAG